MKLIIAIVQDDFATKVIRSLMDKKYRTTKLSSTGGFKGRKYYPFNRRRR